MGYRKLVATALAAMYGPEKGAFDPKAVFRNDGGRPKPTEVRWDRFRPDSNGYFDLTARHGSAGNNSASYMYAEIESPVDQDAVVLLGTDDGAQLWVNGKNVFSTGATRAAAPEQERVKVKLQKGKNTVLLKVANGNNPHGFYFSITSDQELKVAQ